LIDLNETDTQLTNAFSSCSAANHDQSDQKPLKSCVTCELYRMY